jgi:hypothetical protein
MNTNTKIVLLFTQLFISILLISNNESKKKVAPKEIEL